ncbi:hypothetical protein JF770_14760 [Mycobacterium intracellulare]|nr:hypothetical protein [Mycobacterium intracellulare]MCA2304827.1 hypothetical protein [Mycobacterium intracellulare]
MTVIAAIMLAIVELLIKLAPLLVAAGCLWGAVKLIRAHRARQAADEQRLLQPWSRPAPQSSPQVGASTLLPPVIAHRERMYVVRGEDTGLASDRDDGYVNVSAAALPRVHRLPAAYHHRRKFTPRRITGHRPGRRRP